MRGFYRDMIRLRRNMDGVSAGLLGPSTTVTHLNDTGGNKVIMYRRWGTAPDDDVMVVANFGGRAYTRYDLGLPAYGDWHVRMDSDRVSYGADFGGGQAGPITAIAQPRDGLAATGTISLAPYSIVVLSR